MEQLKALKEQLVSVVQGQMSDLKNTNAEELGEVVDMIKDLADAMKLCEEEKYYKTITEAMKKQDKEDPRTRYYNQMYLPYGGYPPEPMYYTEERDMDRHMGRMYYRGQPRDSQGRFESGSRSMYGDHGSESNASSMHGRNGTWSAEDTYGNHMYHEHEFPLEMRDAREGRSGISRRMYMESKEMHKDKADKIKDLENYMKELSEDLVEMIKDASPEEKQLLEKKMTALATKVASLPNA